MLFPVKSIFGLKKIQKKNKKDMKKLLIIISFVCLFSSCDDHYITEHFFSVSNLNSDTLELRYQAINMDSLIDTMVIPRINRGFPLMGTFTESGKEDRLSNEAILNHFKVFEFIKGQDTFRLNETTLSSWLIHHDREPDTEFRRHSYEIKVTNEDLE